MRISNSQKTIIKVRGIILHNDRLLTVRHSHASHFVALPGGHLEWGEDIKECLSRELIEELGVKPDIGKLLYINSYTEKDNKHYIEFFFEIKNSKDYAIDIKKVARSHGHEIVDIIWVNPMDTMVIMPEQIEKDLKEGTLISDTVKYIKRN